MKLEQWLKKHEISQAELSRMLGCSRHTILRAVNRNSVSKQMAEKISKATGGAVSPAEVLGIK